MYFSISELPENLAKLVKFGIAGRMYCLNIMLFFMYFESRRQMLIAYFRKFKSKNSMRKRIELKASFSSRNSGISDEIFSKA